MKQEIKKIDFENNHSLQIEVVHLSGLIKKHGNALTVPHRTNFYHIFLFDDCSPTHIVDFTPIKIKPKTLLFVDKDRVHKFDDRLPYDGKVLIFTDHFYCITEEDKKFLHRTILFNDLIDKPNFRIKNLFSKFITICTMIDEERKDPLDSSTHNILKNHLHNFLLLAEREKQKQGFSNIKKSVDLDYTMLFRDLLEQQFTAVKNVYAYSHHLHISEKRLNLATTKILGKTPKEMIDERIVLEAKRMLVHENQSIKQIGQELGFEEPAYFIKFFKKHSHHTPVEFRESHLL